MTDTEILQQIHEELKRVDHPPFDAGVIDLYGRLIERVPEDGFELFLPDKDISDLEEQALGVLNRYQYVEMQLTQNKLDGYVYQVNLRGKRFYEIANKLATSSGTNMLDSGHRETFETGAVRDAADGKSRPDLISPFATERLGEWLRLGAEKYAERNWEAGIPISRSLASLHRHLMKYQQGANDEDHLAAILCNAMFICHTEEMIKRGVLPQSLDDLPKYCLPNSSDDYTSRIVICKDVPKIVTNNKHEDANIAIEERCV
jgi:hypothetical protein